MKKHFLFGTIIFCLLISACTKKRPAAVKTESNEKIVVYQLLPRIFGNYCLNNKFAGTYYENGCGKFVDITDEALASIKELGATHVWYTGVIQQATKTDRSEYGLPRQSADVVKGEAGSPYAIVDYYAVSADLATDPAKRMEEFEALVERTHNAGLKMLIDFVPNHVAREYHSVMDLAEDLGATDDSSKAFDPQNNFYYIPGESLDITGIVKQPKYSETPAKASGNDVFTNKPNDGDWYETVKLNYGVDYSDGSKHFDPIPSTWLKMTDILLYWAGKGADGFRCDMSEMVPVEFWHYAIAKVKEKFPGTLFVAEIYNPKSYVSYVEEGGFDYLYDKVELYDSIRAVVEGKRPARIIASVFDLPTYNSSVKDHMLNFLENHDEQRIASEFFGRCPQAGRPALAVSALCNANPFMVYFGQEFGEPSMDAEGYQGADGRTTIFDYWGLERMAKYKEANYNTELLPAEWQVLRSRYQDLLNIAKTNDAALNGKFIDLYQYNKDNEEFDSEAVYAFARQTENETLFVMANFSNETKNVVIKTGDIIQAEEEFILDVEIPANDYIIYFR